MRSAFCHSVGVFCILLLASTGIVSAFTDFYGMSSPPTRQVLSDGTVHIAHDVHHNFPEHGTFFKASYTARHDSKWHFVELSALVPDLSSSMKCSSAEGSDIVLMNPSAELLTELRKQELADTVVTAHPRHHCGGKGIFRKLTGLAVTEGNNRATLKTAPLTYTHIFRDVSFKMETNHVHQSTVTSPQQSRRLGGTRSSRNFAAQSIFGFFKHIGEDLVHGAEDVFHAVEDVGRDVFEAAGTIIELASGNYDHDRTFPLPGVNWDPNYSTHGWDVSTPTSLLALSVVFQPSITFELEISDYHLRNFEVYFSGSFSAALRGMLLSQQGSSGSYLHGEFETAITKISLSPITFMLGPVPVILKPTIPINVGAEVSVLPDFDFTAEVTADASIVYGVSWTPGNGFDLLRQDGFTHSYDFNPKPFQSQVTASPYIQPLFVMEIDYIGNVGIGSKLSAQIIIQPNVDCSEELTVNLVPAISIYAGLKIDIFGVDVWSCKAGPYTMWSATYPLLSYCVPAAGVIDLDNSMTMDQSSGSGSISGTVPSTSAGSTAAQSQSGGSATGRGFALQQNHFVPQQIITRTKHSRLGSGFNGKAWQGRSKCVANSVDMTYSIQYASDTNGDNLIVLTVSHSMEQPRAASALLQAAYRSEGPAPHVGQTATYSLVPKPYYSVSSNDTVVNLTAPEQLHIIVSTIDTRYITLESDVTCGAVQVTCPEANNDSSVFRLLGAAATGSALGEKSKKVQDEGRVQPVVIIAGAASGVLLLAAAALAIVLRTKRRSSELKSQTRSSEMEALENPLVEDSHREATVSNDQPIQHTEGMPPEEEYTSQEA